MAPPGACTAPGGLTPLPMELTSTANPTVKKGRHLDMPRVDAGTDDGATTGPRGRTPVQRALSESAAAWRWFLLGYEAGVAAGYDIGAQEIVDQIKAAGAELRPLMAEVSRGIETTQYRDRRAREIAADEDPTERHRRCAASWGLPETGAA